MWDVERLDLDAYLRRIEADRDDPPGALHRAHIGAIPFENLDIRLGRGIAVDLDSIQAKLVRARRGGYCYEHGLLFAAALERLGFPVRRLLARVGGFGEQPRARTHMALLVDAGGRRWLADVGFGSGLLEPIPFEAGPERRQGGWTFRLVELGTGRWELHERRGGDWQTLYGFADEWLYPADVVLANHFSSTFPRSPFVTRVVAVRKDEQALTELVDGTLTVTRPDGSADVREVEPGPTLRDVFGLEVRGL